MNNQDISIIIADGDCEVGCKTAARKYIKS